METSDTLVVFFPGIHSSAEFVFDGPAKFLQENGFRTAFIEYPFKEKRMREKPDRRITQLSMPMLLDKSGEDLVEIFLKNPYSRIHIAGHSLGAMVGLYQAGTLEMKDRIGGVTAICPAPLDGMKPIPLNWERLFCFWPGIVSEFLQKIKIDMPVRRTFRSACLVLPKDLSRSELVKIWENMRRESLLILQALSYRNGQRPPAVDFKNITCKVNIICGTQDKLIPLSVPKELNDKIDESDCYVLESSHYPFLGASSLQFNNLLLKIVSA